MNSKQYFEDVASKWDEMRSAFFPDSLPCNYRALLLASFLSLSRLLRCKPLANHNSR